MFRWVSTTTSTGRTVAHSHWCSRSNITHTSRSCGAASVTRAMCGNVSSDPSLQSIRGTHIPSPLLIHVRGLGAKPAKQVFFTLCSLPVIGKQKVTKLTITGGVLLEFRVWELNQSVLCKCQTYSKVWLLLSCVVDQVQSVLRSKEKLLNARRRGSGWFCHESTVLWDWR